MNSRLFVNIVVMGPPNSGKSCFISKYCKNSFLEEYQNHSIALQHTIEAGTKDKEITLDIKEISNSCDTDRIHEYLTRYSAQWYKAVSAVIILFDKSQLESIFEVEGLYVMAKKYMPNGTVLIVANKCDLEQAISSEEALAKVLNLGCLYSEASAKTGENLSFIFEVLINIFFDSLSK